MSNLVEAHAAAVKPSLAHVDSPTAAVAEQAKARAEVAKAAGDEAMASRAAELAEAMAPAPPAPVEPEREILDDEYLEIARHLERGMWVEFESDDGQLAFAKLAWVSPLRGHVPVHEPPGSEGAVDHRRGARRPFPHRQGASRRGRAADRSRVQQHDGADGRQVRRARGLRRPSSPKAGIQRRSIRKSRLPACAGTTAEKCPSAP